jgi:hypothetical protein
VQQAFGFHLFRARWSGVTFTYVPYHVRRLSNEPFCTHRTHWTHPSFLSLKQACVKLTVRLWDFALHLFTPQPVIMLFAMFLLAGLATAVRYDIEAPPRLSHGDPNPVSQPVCTVSVKGAKAWAMLTRPDGVCLHRYLCAQCANNLGGICDLDGGVASFFRIYAACLSRKCRSTQERVCE